MTEQCLILIEKTNRKQFIRFIEMFMHRQEIPLTEIRSTIPKSTFYDFILVKLHNINKTVQKIDPGIEYFIKPTLSCQNERVVQAFIKNNNIEIIFEDENYFYLKVKN
jgi:hypothetical protein